MQGSAVKAETPLIEAEAPAARRGIAHALQALQAIVLRELFKFSRQTGRLVSALEIGRAHV